MKICTIEGCEKPDAGTRGWCHMHYWRYLQYGATELPKKPPRSCSIDGCGRKMSAKGLCSMHWQRQYKHGDPLHIVDRSSSLCTIEGCEREHYGKGLCRMHWERLRRRGDPLDTAVRSGEQHQGWRGDHVGYGAMHRRVGVLRGKASEHFCECGQRAEEWAYNHCDPDYRREQSA